MCMVVREVWLVCMVVHEVCLVCVGVHVYVICTLCCVQLHQ